MFIVGLTGGIGSGKSAASSLFESHNIIIVDADICARLVVQPGTQALKEITTFFGDSILLNDGSLNRPKLRSVIFTSVKKKQWLENLLHPLIGAEILKQLAGSQSAYTILVSPLLIESGQNKMCQKVIVVDIPELLQIERTKKRDQNSTAQIKSIMQSQAERENRLQSADFIIDNSKDFDYLANQISTLHQKLLQLATI